MIQLDASAAAATGVDDDAINLKADAFARSLDASGLTLEPPIDDPNSIPNDPGLAGSIVASGQTVVIESTALLTVQDEMSAGTVGQGYADEPAADPASQDVVIAEGAQIFADATVGEGGFVRVGATNHVDHARVTTIAGGMLGCESQIRSDSVIYDGQTGRTAGISNPGSLLIEALARSENGGNPHLDTISRSALRQSTSSPGRSELAAEAVSADLQNGTDVQIRSANSISSTRISA